MIPQDKSAAVTRGLGEAFGVTTFEDIRMITMGLTSDLIFRIVVRDSPYLLRIIIRADAMGDPTCQFTCMKAAAEAGLAAHVRYTSIEDRISITDFVETVPFAITDARIRIPSLLQTLHALPPFPRAFNYDTANNGFIRRFQVADILPKSEIEEGFAGYAQVAAVYPRLDRDIVSSHNDLKPENILFDGERVSLGDWKAALLNDRYFDLSIVANFVVTSHAEERAYLQEYFGQPPDEYQLARFFLMRQVMHMFAAAMFLFLGSPGKPVNQSENAPEFKDLHRRIWAGEINLADNEMKTLYGRVHWEQLLQNTRQTRFSEALTIVSDRYPRPQGSRPLLLVAS